MPKKTKRLHTQRQPAKPDAATASYEQPQGSSSPDATNRKLEKMPHERDESARDTGNRLDEAVVPSGREIHQAHEDIEKGLVDTDRRGVPDDIPSSRRNRAS
ncbi:MAG: hypothetical protein ACXWUK_08870 [Burkholderiales bacterium]